MKLKNLILLILISTCMQCTPAFQSINAGISVDYIKDVNDDIIYSAPFSGDIPSEIGYSDGGYLIKYKPLDMLSNAEISLKRIPDKKTIVVSQVYETPSVYNISFSNGGKINYAKNASNIEELVIKNPNRSEYLYAYAIKLSNAKKYNEAIIQIDRALKINQAYALGHFLKGDILRAMGDYKQAAREYFATININPYCTDAYFNIAKMLEHRGNNDLALSYYKMAYAVSPNDLEIRNLILKLDRKGA